MTHFGAPKFVMTQIPRHRVLWVSEVVLRAPESRALQATAPAHDRGKKPPPAIDERKLAKRSAGPAWLLRGAAVGGRPRRFSRGAPAGAA